MNESQPYKIYTYGCKVNTYDSGLMEKNLHQWGFNDQWKNQRVHILNTCAVTAEATKEAVKNIRRLKVKDPFCTIVVTGCSAQVDTKIFEKLPGADLIVANSHKNFLPEIIEKYLKGDLKEKVFKSNIFRKEDLEMGGGKESHHTRSFLKIQDGCNSFCSYCIIPYARGKSRSIPIEVLVQRVRELEQEGYQEVVLTGVHIGDYQSIQNKTSQVSKSDSQIENLAGLESLIEEILNKTKIPRLRLTSLEPIEVTDSLLQLFKNDRLCPHFHMSIQSGEDKVLKDMKRNYGSKDVYTSLHRIRECLPNSFIGMDVIVGFPTETEESFQATYELLKNTPWTRLHVFPFSERTGTKAAQMTEFVPISIRQKRSELLRALSWSRLQEEANNQIGKVKKVLLLKGEGPQFQGLSRDYWSVEFDSPTQFNDLKSLSEKEISITIQSLYRPSLSGHELRLKGVAKWNL